MVANLCWRWASQRELYQTPECSEVMRNFDIEVLSNAMAVDFNDFLHVVWIPTMTFCLRDFVINVEGASWLLFEECNGHFLVFCLCCEVERSLI